jgi:hypothetical protein
MKSQQTSTNPPEQNSEDFFTSGWKILGPKNTCRGYKYDPSLINKYTGFHECYRQGFHFSTLPLLGFSNYDILQDKIYRVRGNHCKLRDDIACTGELHFDQELSLPEMVKEAVAWVESHAVRDPNIDSDGYQVAWRPSKHSFLSKPSIANAGSTVHLLLQGAKTIITESDVLCVSTSPDVTAIATRPRITLVSTGADAKLATTAGSYSAILSTGTDASITNIAASCTSIYSSGFRARISVHGEGAKLRIEGDAAQVFITKPNSRVDVRGRSAFIQATDTDGMTIRFGPGTTLVILAEIFGQRIVKTFTTGKNGVRSGKWYQILDGDLAPLIKRK